MNPQACRREDDVLDALASRRWPHRCEEEFRQHVAACTACRDLIDVTSALLDDRDLPAAAALPPASVVWWRAQLRARSDAARAAATPLRLSLRVAIACVIFLATAGAMTLAPAVLSVMQDLRSWIMALDGNYARDAALAAFASRGVQLAAAAWLVLGPVAVYFAFARD